MTPRHRDTARPEWWRGIGLMAACVLLCAAFGVAAQEEAAPPQEGEGAAPLPEKAQDPLGSPRATIETFLKTMNELQVDETREDSLKAALSCIYLDPDSFSEQERIEQGPGIAQRIFEIIDSSTSVDIERVPDDFEGDNYELRVGRDQVLTLHRYSDEGDIWRFSYQQTVEHIEEIHEEVVESAEETPPEVRANPKLATPRATMRTFVEGIKTWDEGGDVDAISTLDLSGIEEAVRESEAVRLSRMLKDILDHHEEVIYQKIPDEADRENPYVYLDHPDGKIVIAPIKDEDSGLTEWKFSATTLESLSALRDAFMKKELVVDTPETGPTVRSIQVRDWVSSHFPFLVEKRFFVENWQWAGMFVIILLGFLVSRLVVLPLVLTLRGTFSRERIELDRKIEKDFLRPIRIAIMAWVWWVGLLILGLPHQTLSVLLIAARSITAAAAVWAFYRLIDLVGSYLSKKAQKTANRFDDLLVPLVTRSLKVFAVVFGVVVVADVLALPIRSVLAGLGLGGLAFALAAKDTVSNIFGSLTVLLDRPFEIGDWIVTGGVEGSVESVGIRSTRVRTFYNSLITVPNSQLISAVVDNMGARRYRRYKTMIGVAYDTPPEKIDAFCAGIRQLIREHPYTRKDYYHVWLNGFADASLNILLYCFHEVPDWATELRERHRLMLDVIRLANRLGVEFAFPTQTLYMRQEQTPEHTAIDFAHAQDLGHSEATAIVNTFQGGKDAPTPPPVTMTAGEAELAPDEARKLGAAEHNDDE